MRLSNMQILNKAVEKAQKNTNIVFLIPIFHEHLIFSHDFAKAFWGEEDYTDGKIVICNHKAWQYHLQQMVLYEEPLNYLERFL